MARDRGAGKVLLCDVNSQRLDIALQAVGRFVDDAWVVGEDNAVSEVMSRTGAASAYEAYDVSFPHPGWAEQDPRLWTAALHATISRLVKKVPERPSAIRALSFGSQLDGMVVCDRRGSPLRPAMIWMDRRAEAQATALAARISRA